MLLLLILLPIIYTFLICEEFPIHHRFDNCPTRRTSFEYCPNEGTWECPYFRCKNPNSDSFGSYCEYGNTEHRLCCTYKNIHYIDFWFRNIDSSSWKINFFNFYIQGYSNGNININGTSFSGLYVVPTDRLTFMSLVLNYNDNCGTTISLYINGTYMGNATAGSDLDIIPFSSQYILLMSTIRTNRLYFVSAHERIPTPDQIMDLYNFGVDRSLNEGICYNLTIPELDLCQDLVKIQNHTITVLNNTIIEHLLTIIKFIYDLETCNDTLQECQEELDQCNETAIECCNNCDECQEELIQCNETSILCQKNLNQCNKNRTECCDNYEECQEDLIELEILYLECNDSLGDCININITKLLEIIKFLNDTAITQGILLEECNGNITILEDCSNTTLLEEDCSNTTLLEECSNTTQQLQMMLNSANSTADGWIIAFIVTVSILGLLLCTGFIFLLFLLLRRRIRNYEENYPTTSFEMKNIGPDVFFK